MHYKYSVGYRYFFKNSTTSSRTDGLPYILPLIPTFDYDYLQDQIAEPSPRINAVRLLNFAYIKVPTYIQINTLIHVNIHMSIYKQLYQVISSYICIYQMETSKLAGSGSFSKVYMGT